MPSLIEEKTMTHHGSLFRTIYRFAMMLIFATSGRGSAQAVGAVHEEPWGIGTTLLWLGVPSLVAGLFLLTASESCRSDRSGTECREQPFKGAKAAGGILFLGGLGTTVFGAGFYANDHPRSETADGRASAVTAVRTRAASRLPSRTSILAAACV